MLKTSPEGILKKARMVPWKLCEKFNLKKSEKWYLHNPQTVSEKVNHNLIWYINIQCDNIIGKRKPDIAIVNKMEITEEKNYRCWNT